MQAPLHCFTADAYALHHSIAHVHAVNVGVGRPGSHCFGVLPQGQQPPVRRLAELHYKASLALQFLHKAGPAKEHTEVGSQMYNHIWGRKASRMTSLPIKVLSPILPNLQTAVQLVQGRIAELEAGPAAGEEGAAVAPAAAAPDAAAPAAAGEPADTAAAAAPTPAAQQGPGPAAAAAGDEADAGAATGGATDPAAGSSGRAPGKSAAAKEVQALRDSLEGLQVSGGDTLMHCPDTVHRASMQRAGRSRCQGALGRVL